MWDVDDQDKALAWQVDESDRCPGCGTRSYEADDFRPQVITCRVCQNNEMAAAADQDRRPVKARWRHLVMSRRRDGSS